MAISLRQQLQCSTTVLLWSMEIRGLGSCARSLGQLRTMPYSGHGWGGWWADGFDGLAAILGNALWVYLREESVR